MGDGGDFKEARAGIHPLALKCQGYVRQLQVAQERLMRQIRDTVKTMKEAGRQLDAGRQADVDEVMGHLINNQALERGFLLRKHKGRKGRGQVEVGQGHEQFFANDAVLNFIKQGMIAKNEKPGEKRKRDGDGDGDGATLASSSRSSSPPSSSALRSSMGS